MLFMCHLKCSNILSYKTGAFISNKDKGFQMIPFGAVILVMVYNVSRQSINT